MRYKFKNIQVEPLTLVFFYVPIIPYRSGFAKLSRQLDRGASGRFPFRRFADLIKDNQKQRLNTLAVLGLAFFFTSLITPGRRRTLNLRRIVPCGRCPREYCVALRALRCESTTAEPSSCRSCMPCKMSYVFTARL